MRSWTRVLSRRIMSTSYSDVPLGVRLIQRVGTPSPTSYKVSVLVITYLAYMCYHMTRKPISVVKAVLQNCTITPHATVDEDLVGGTHISTSQRHDSGCAYPPFDGPNSEDLFAALDLSFLLAYAVAMFISGLIAERMSLRYFLSLGMILSGFFCYLFGVAKTADIHSIWYFVFVQLMAGVFQTTGWPGVVAVVGRWFGKGKRGLIFGIWNSHTSIGNVLGTLLPTYYLATDWSRSFIVPGMIMGVMGFLVYLLLVDSPEIVGCQERPVVPNRRSTEYSRVEQQGAGDSDGSEADDAPIVIGQHSISVRSSSVAGNEALSRAAATERTQLLGAASNERNHGHPESTDAAIGFMGAFRIPGVIDFSLCLFFTKLVSYTFLFWLPMYITHTTDLGPEKSAKISTMFDYGGILGAIAAGAISDYTNKPATTCAALLVLAIPTLLVYVGLQTSSIVMNYFMLFVVGIMVNGPYALITTSVSAELGQHPTLNGNSKAVATVTAIIDGTGSFGAALGPLLAGLLSNRYNWNSVIFMVAISEAIAILLLLRLVRREFEPLRRNVRIE